MTPKRAYTSPAPFDAAPLSKRLRHLYRRKAVVEALIRSLVKYDRALRSAVAVERTALE